MHSILGANKYKERFKLYHYNPKMDSNFVKFKNV